jgi:hypothetical protein
MVRVLPWGDTVSLVIDVVRAGRREIEGGRKMRELWTAFLARMVYWLTPKPHVPPPAPIIEAPEPPLMPGKCECGHIRCIHVGCKGRCMKSYSKSDEFPDGAICLCQVYIPKKDNPPDPGPVSPAPSVDELERMWQK